NELRHPGGDRGPRRGPSGRDPDRSRPLPARPSDPPCGGTGRRRADHRRTVGRGPPSDCRHCRPGPRLSTPEIARTREGEGRAIAALEELRMQAVEDRVEADLSLRRGGDLVAELEEVIAGNPFRERLRGFLMLALHRAGRRADALEAYRKTRSLFAEELGLEPGPGLRQLEAAIFREDPGRELKPTIRSREQSLTAPSSLLPRERRTVAVVAVDATPTADAAPDPEALGSIGAHAARVASDALERHGARVE